MENSLSDTGTNRHTNNQDRQNPTHCAISFPKRIKPLWPQAAVRYIPLQMLS